MRTAQASLGLALVVSLLSARPAGAATVTVTSAAGLQPALNAAVGGDTIVLLAGVTYPGNFLLPVHAGSGYVTVRSSTSDALLPPAGTRLTPAAAALLPKIQSTNSSPALRTAPGASYWRIQYVEFGANAKGAGDIIQLGDGSAIQNTLGALPQFLVLQSVYVHGDPLVGQKRGIALNSGDTTIADSHVSNIKGVGIDTQAIGGWNGSGPYRIHNNYLEAAGEVFMIGGDDPKIPGLIPSDIELRGNTLSRPLSWRDPIIAAPVSVVGVPAAGTLPAGVYGYRVVARRPADSAAIASSPASTEVTVLLPAAGGVSLTWTAVPNATEYRIYGRSQGAPDRYWTVTAPTTTFVDSGSAGTAGTPGTATVWTVKNLFELKNARRVQVDHNVLEHNWKQAQSGIAVVLTPRNQGGNCTWCVVEDVTFEYNTVRSVAAGISVLGWDNLQPSQQANGIRIRNNEFSDVSRFWGSTAYFMYIMDNPRDIVVDHNTFISPDGYGVVNVSGAATTGFVFTNNVARHNSYGIIGTGYGVGNSSIAQFFPGSTITRNVFAGGNASLYPAGNLFPTVADFVAQFVSYAGGDFSLVPTSSWRNAGTDGADLGAVAGGGTAVTPALVIDSISLANGTVGVDYSGVVAAHGGSAPYSWSIASGALPSGLNLHPTTGSISGAPTTIGTSAFTVHVVDAAGANASQPLSIEVAAPINRAPAAVNDTVQAIEETSVNIVLNGTDPDGDALTYALITPPLNGVVEGSAPHLVYSGNTNFYGTDSLTFTVTDAAGATSTGTVAINVTNVNDAPVAMSQSLATPQNTPVTVALTALDADGDALGWSIGQPQHGSVSGSGPNLIYTPAPGYAGSDAFTYAVTDGAVATSATVTITVAAVSVTITTATLPDGKVNRAYSVPLTASGGATPYQWSVVGQLPAGLTLDPASGMLSGKPAAAGTSAFTVRVTDAGGQTDDQALTIRITPGGRK
jgi:hypothetical protein